MTEPEETKPKQPKKKPRKRSFLVLVLLLWGVILIGVGGFAGFIYAVSAGSFGPLPSLEELENPKSYLASEIYSEDGVLLGKYYLQNRSNVQYKDLSPNLINALVATEDVRYLNHSGIDLRGLMRALAYRGKRGGASTITQQLAKNLFHEREKDFKARVLQKFKEWVIAIRIEQNYTKEEILTMYLNTVQFSGRSYGIKSAAKEFFNKFPRDLNAQESAILVGMLKAITQYSPARNPENAMHRRNTVLGQMHKYQYLTTSQFDSIKALPIELNYEKEDHNVGLATYFREHLRGELTDWCKENGYDLYKDGLKIYTTINSRMQQYAESAVEEHIASLQKSFYKHWKGRVPWGKHTELLEFAMKRSERYRLMKLRKSTPEEIEEAFNTPTKMTIFSWQGEIDTTMTPMDSIKYYKYFLQTGFMSMDPHTGHIKAWVGGIDHKYFKYDHVNIEAKRQVGSTFKPFVYTMAIDNGWSPCFKAPNLPVTFEDYENYTPRNAGGKDGGEMTLYRGLALSVNNIVAYLLKQLGPDGPKAVIDLAHKMGVISPIDPYPSICYGVSDASVYEMVGAFSTYANQGVWTEPTYLTRVEDKFGNVLHEFIPRTVEALSEQTAYIMLKMMEKGVNHGTGYRVRGTYKIYHPAAGKTGTTQNQSDGWFIGATPDLVSGAWVGCEDRAVHFRSLSLGGGNNMALPIWGLYMQKVYADTTINLSTRPFDEPKEELTIELDCDKYKDTNKGNPDFMDGI